jgi:hypothetical protein
MPMNTEFAKEAGLEQLEARIQGQLRGRVRELQLFIWADGVVLRGFARTYYAKQLAQHVVMTHTQLPILANEIEVH